MTLEAKDVVFSYDGKAVLDRVSFSVSSGEAVALLGPNGAGKSTLFKCLLGFRRPLGGSVLLDGKNIGDYSRRELARMIAYIPQYFSAGFNHTVSESVLMGFSSRLSLFDVPSLNMKKRALEALELFGIADLAGKGVRDISGGERQLALLARSWVQDARILIMDEPASNLDYGNAMRIMEMIGRVSGEGRAVLFSTHDPNQALAGSTRIIALKSGAVLYDGRPRDVEGKLFGMLYGVDASICPVCGQVRAT